MINFVISEVRSIQSGTYLNVVTETKVLRLICNSRDRIVFHFLGRSFDTLAHLLTCRVT